MFGGWRRTLSLFGIPYLFTLILTGGVLWAQDASTGAPLAAGSCLCGRFGELHRHDREPVVSSSNPGNP